MEIIKLQCDGCGTFFERKASIIRARKNRGNTKTFCTNSCYLQVSRAKVRNCIQCGIDFKHRGKFCSHSCAATHNNKARFGNNTCYCGIAISKNEIFCGKICRKKEKLRAWLCGETVYNTKSGSYPAFIKEYILDECGHKCSECGWAKIHLTTGKSPLEMDHIDGDCTNNTYSNLRILCPNCHSLTDTFRSLNRKT